MDGGQHEAVRLSRRWISLANKSMWYQLPMDGHVTTCH